MDNGLLSLIKRGFKLTTSYLVILILLLVFVLPILYFARDSISLVMFVFSFLLFLILARSFYLEMVSIAAKEKNPQFNINPSPYKGLLYGIIGIIPLIIIQSIIISIRVPEDFTILHRRIYQGFSGPLYWFANLMGNEPVLYILSFILLIPAAGLGYYAGYHEFSITGFIREKLGIKENKKIK
jgi:hypothetical protein